MEEKVLSGKKHGMLTLLCCVAVMLLAVAGVAYGAITAGEDEISPLLIVSVIVLCVAWIPLAGLRILKPQEALVLTLFGKYVVRPRFVLFLAGIPSGCRRFGIKLFHS